MTNIKRVKTGVPGFDELIEGGIPKVLMSFSPEAPEQAKFNINTTYPLTYMLFIKNKL